MQRKATYFYKVSKAHLILFLLAMPLFSLAQDEWDTWDKNYKSVSYSYVLSFEQKYADSIERNLTAVKDYCRADKYKIAAEFTGKSRPISKEVLGSIYRVFDLRVGNTAQLDGKLATEFLFTIEGKQYWLPIQNHLEKPFLEEVKKGTEVGLYCLYLNEHTVKKELFTILLISEFRLPKP